MIVFFISMFLGFNGTIVLGAEEPSVDTPSGDPAPAPAAAPEENEAAPSSAGQDDLQSSVQVTAPGNITVDFKDAEIKNVLRILAFKSGVNIVAGKDVTGSVTIRLVDVPWEKALDVILKTYGYAYDRQENVIRVSTLENLKKEELSTEVFTLNYSRASDIEKSIKDLLSDRGKMRSDARSNMIVVTDMPTSLQSIRTVIQRLDMATPQVLIQAKVIEMTLGSTERLGIDWNVKAGVSGASRPTTLPWRATQRSVFTSILPYGRGTTSTVVDNGGGTATAEDFPKGKDLTNIQPTFPVVDKGEFTFGQIDFTDMRAMLELIMNRDDTKILS